MAAPRNKNVANVFRVCFCFLGKPFIYPFCAMGSPFYEERAPRAPTNRQLFGSTLFFSQSFEPP